MNWKRAKNYTILFLFLLNVLLLFLNTNNDKKYYLTNKNIEMIEELLDKNGIRLDCAVPKNFRAMKQLAMLPYAYDNAQIQRLFFGEKTDIKRTNEFGKTIFKADKETLTIENNFILFESEAEPPEGFEYTRDGVIAACGGHVKKIEKYMGRLVLNNVTDYYEEGVYTVEYTGEFKDERVFYNYVLFKVSETGIKSIEASFYEPFEFIGDKMEICSGSDALFTFMSEIVKFYGDSDEILIKRVELGYYGDSPKTQKFNSVPCYKITAYFDGELDRFYVNAYSGTMFQ